MKKSYFILIFIILIIASYMLIAGTAFGYGVSDIKDFTGQTREGAGLGNLEYADIAAGAINIMLSIVGAIFVILIISSGFTWMISQGNQDKVDKARKTLSYAVVGLIVIIASYSIASVVIRAIEEAPQGPLTGGPSGYGGGNGGGNVTTCTGSGLQCVDGFGTTSAEKCESEGSAERMNIGIVNCIDECLKTQEFVGTCAGLNKTDCDGNSACKWFDPGIAAAGVCDFKCNRRFCCQTRTNPCADLGVSKCGDKKVCTSGDANKINQPCTSNASCGENGACSSLCTWVPSATGLGGECLLEGGSPGGPERI
ncbi:pilin [Patescibacteria group bacterium]